MRYTHRIKKRANQNRMNFKRYHYPMAGSGIVSNQSEQISNRPLAIRQTRLHRGRHAQRLMIPAPVVVREKDRRHRGVILKLLTVAVRQPCIPTHPHSDSQIRSLDKAGADMRLGRYAAMDFLFD